MASKLLRVDQPSVRDLETTISSLDESIAEFETQDHKDLGVRIKLADASPENALVTDHERKIFDAWRHSGTTEKRKDCLQTVP